MILWSDDRASRYTKNTAEHVRIHFSEVFAGLRSKFPPANRIRVPQHA
jgi:hypothetical protein